MATLGGKHVQTRTGRELTWWSAYEVVDGTELSYVAVIREGRNLVGQHEATLRYDPTGIRAKSVVRMHLLKHLGRTAFEKGRAPNPKWIGWYGPFL